MADHRIYLIRNGNLDDQGRVKQGTSQAIFPWLNGRDCYWAQEGVNLGDFLTINGVFLSYDCGGKGTCGKCLVQISPFCQDPSDLEFESVLACQTIVEGDLVVNFPGVGPLCDLEEIYFEYGAGEFADITSPNYEYHWKKSPVKKFGLAVDLGTTTIVTALVDLRTGRILGRCSVRNPQSRYGADVITRIGYAGSAPERLSELQRLLISALASIVLLFEEKCHLEAESIGQIILAGNSVMEYLFLGLDPSSMGEYPFILPRKIFEEVDFSQLNFPKVASLASDLEIFCFPLFSSFVGGDIVSGIFSLGADVFRRSDPFIFFDIGTNGEIVLVRDGKITVTACAAGPAFEGAGIAFGMCGRPGAINHIDFGPKPKLEVIGGVLPSGICGSGMVDLIAALLRAETIGANGRFTLSPENELADRLRSYNAYPAFLVAGGDYSGQLPENIVSVISEKFRPVWLTQKDIRQIQLAVGAVRAGFEALLNSEKISAGELKKIFLAGDFGSHLRTENARCIGLLPRESRADQVEITGNSSLRGALSLLLDPAKKSEIFELVREARFIDLSSLAEFQEIFINAMNFPNT